MAEYSFDTPSARRIVRMAQTVEAMPRPTGKRLRGLPGGGDGKRDESLQVTGAASVTERGVKYWAARTRLHTNGVLAEGTDELWLFHFDQARDLRSGCLYHGRQYSGNYAVGGVSRSVYGTVDCTCACIETLFCETSGWPQRNLRLTVTSNNSFADGDSAVLSYDFPPGAPSIGPCQPPRRFCYQWRNVLESASVVNGEIQLHTGAFLHVDGVSPIAGRLTVTTYTWGGQDTDPPFANGWGNGGCWDFSLSVRNLNPFVAMSAELRDPAGFTYRFVIEEL